MYAAMPQVMLRLRCVAYWTVGAIHESPAPPVVILSEGADGKKDYHVRPASDRVEGPLSGAGSNELLSRG